MKKIFIQFIFLIIGIFPTIAQSSGAGAKKNASPIWLADCEKKLLDLRKSKELDPISDFLPFFGKKVREMGYSLPLPFGVGTSFMAMRQTNKISDFNLIIQDQEIPFDLKFYNAVSTDLNYTFRPDVWIFPFLNVYGVFGYSSGRIKPTVLIPGITANLPIIGDVNIIKPIELNDEIKYKGSTVGLGSMVAGGFKSYFFVLDYNYTWSNMDVMPQTIEVQTITGRIGVMLEGFKTIGKGTFWLGAMYIDINQYVTDMFDLRSQNPDIADVLGDEIGYSMKLGVAEPLNLLIGGSWSFHPRMTFVLEAGIGDRSQFLLSVDYRF